MAFRTRCPECRAKLEFDEAPEPDEAVECTRCGHVFDGAEAKPLKKKKKVAVGGGDEDDRPRKKKKKALDPNAPKKRKVKKKKANLLFLWIMLGGVVVIGPFLGWFCYKLWFAPGKIGTLMGYVPAEANLLRGVDVARLSQYPGYQNELKKAMEGPFAVCRDAFAKAAGADAEKFLDYAMTARICTGGTMKTMHAFQTLEPFDSELLVKPMGGKKETVNGTEVVKLPGSLEAPLAGAYAFCPDPRHIVIVTNDGDQQAMLKSVIAAKDDPKGKSLWPELNTAGMKTARANIWTLLRCTGDFKDRIKYELASRIKSDYNELSNKLSATKTFGVYLYFGKMVKYGIAIDTESPETASEFVKSMKEEANFGLGDETEFKPQMKRSFSMVNDRDFKSEFMGNMRWKSSGDCAMMESRMNLDKSLLVLSVFNRSDLFLGVPEKLDDEGGGGGGRRR